jgi:hypothetical protein
VATKPFFSSNPANNKNQNESDFGEFETAPLSQKRVDGSKNASKWGDLGKLVDLSGIGKNEEAASKQQAVQQAAAQNSFAGLDGFSKTPQSMMSTAPMAMRGPAMGMMMGMPPPPQQHLQQSIPLQQQQPMGMGMGMSPQPMGMGIHPMGGNPGPMMMMGTGGGGMMYGGGAMGPGPMGYPGQQQPGSHGMMMMGQPPQMMGQSMGQPQYGGGYPQQQQGAMPFRY